MEEAINTAVTENQPVRLNLSDVLSAGLASGLKNIVSLLIALVLWLATIWIPYINVGTTIAVWAIPLELARGKTINPLFIFDSKYRQYMGEVFLTGVFAGLGIIAGTLFMIIPGIVLSLAWSQAIYLVQE